MQFYTSKAWARNFFLQVKPILSIFHTYAKLKDHGLSDHNKMGHGRKHGLKNHRPRIRRLKMEF
jgi:hypothetical protein